MNNNLLSSALAIAAKGKPVFPCGLDKRPLTANGFKDAATDTNTITNWWALNPEANIGMPTGAVSGVVVLDVDMDSTKMVNGEQALAELVSRYGPLPETLTVKTPRGGRHIYFKHPGVKVPNSTSKIGPGLDIRGIGGYVLVPPSKTARGAYDYVNRAAIALMPEWLLNQIGSGRGEQSHSLANTTITAATNQEEEGRIRTALASVPASVSHDDWVRVGMALHAWNAGQGKTIWQEWSQTCPEKFNQRDLDAAWNSFKPNGGVGLGTLFALAQQHGWQPASVNKTKSKNNGSIDGESTEVLVPKWPAPPRPEAFYGWLGKYVERLMPHTEADPMALLIQLVVGFGNILGRSAYFQVEADKHYLNMNAVVVGNSSKARKGTSWGHVNKFLKKIDPSWPAPITGLSTGEGLIHQVRDPVVVTNKKTGKEEVEDEGQNDKRLLAVESEFGRLLQCANREGNTLSAVIRQAFDSGDLRVATKASPERATNAHISINGHVTLAELNLLLSKNDSANGLANRFFWVVVKRSKLLPEGGDADAVNFEDIRYQLSEAVIFARQVGRIKLDSEARELWRNIYTALSAEQPGLLGAVTSRGEALVMRLATLLAVTDWSNTISVAHLKAALAIWDYCAASAKFIFGNTLGNPVAERVLATLKQAGATGLTLTGIHSEFNGHLSRGELHAALKELHSQGLANFESVKTSGRPSQVWFATQINSEKSELSGAGNGMTPPASAATASDLSSLNSPTSQAGDWEEDI